LGFIVDDEARQIEFQVDDLAVVLAQLKISWLLWRLDALGSLWLDLSGKISLAFEEADLLVNH